MSSLWTPSGEHRATAGAPGNDESAAPGPGDTEAAGDELVDAELVEELRQARAELAATPAADIVANHAVGLWQLAVLHLTPDVGVPRLEEARLAIDAMGAIVEGLGDRLGAHGDPLRDALAQLRLAFVEVRSRLGAPAPAPEA